MFKSDVADLRDCVRGWGTDYLVKYLCKHATLKKPVLGGGARSPGLAGKSGLAGSVRERVLKDKFELDVRP